MIKQVKLVCEGDGSVGKTCLLITHTGGKFPTEYVPTVFDNYCINREVDGQTISLGLWDIFVKEDGDRLRVLSYPQTDVFLLCFDLSRPATLRTIQEKFAPSLDHHVPEAQRILVGCKSDLRSDESIRTEMVKTSDAIKVQKSIGAIHYIECSAKANINVEELFDTAIRTALNKTNGAKTGKKRIQPCVLS
eukprot:TRINITY_DN2519_c1_g1_i1.p1 TRINITY_DN2519_c1_g1~~TRINITY_DN2519_c1_g1_i1.p1  ORF type:complete len:191 (+),score=15.63 TRINITY_DN2519_c1_g1_i1:98-670(+)